MAEPQQKPPTSVPSVGPQRIKVRVMPLFSTWIYQCEDGSRHLNQRLERLAHQLMQDDRNATRRTNYGGWHYAFDFFELKNEVVTKFRSQMEQHVQAFLNHFRPQERKKKDHFLLRGSLNVNRCGGF